MISNERPSPYGRRPYGPPKPPVNEDTLKTDKIQIERKTFVFTLKENPRGRFLRVTEDVGGRPMPSSSPPRDWRILRKWLTTW